MTKEEAKMYIKENGNPELVIGTLKEMKEQGAEMTIEELDRRIHRPAEPPIKDELQFPQPVKNEPPSYMQNPKFQAIMNEDYTDTEKSHAGYSIKPIVLVYLGMIIGPILMYLPVSLLQTGKPVPFSIPYETFYGICMVLGLIIFGFAVIAPLWSIFEKARQPGWAAIVPIYNIIVLCKITYGNALFALIFFVPIASPVISIITGYGLAKSFGKSTAFSIAYAIFGGILAPILAYGDSDYTGPAF